MKIVQINATCGRGSTGKICVSISKLLAEYKIENYILYCSGDSDYPLGIKCADSNYIRRQSLKARLFGNWGFNSKKSTQKMIRELERIKPDIVHLHNIHGHDCHLEMLISYIKEKKIKVVWTFHDCWAFTGYCMYFDAVGCDKWKTGCNNCRQRRDYSWSLDRSSALYQKKKELLAGLDITVITPSKWLASIARESFLRDYPIKTINNGINLEIFKYTPSDLKRKYKLTDKLIVLGVSFGWSKRKGLDVFIELSKRLPEKYQIILVGTDSAVDKILPNNIISIHRTQSQLELAEIYTAANVFVNPTREDNYPTVNMEALACGAPVVTFRTGGSPEIPDETCGSVVDIDDFDALKKEIFRICETGPYSQKMCLKKSAEFDQNERFKEYLELYERIGTK